MTKELYFVSLKKGISKGNKPYYSIYVIDKDNLRESGYLISETLYNSLLDLSLELFEPCLGTFDINYNNKVTLINLTR